MKKLEPINCDINVLEYVTDYGSLVEYSIAISTKETAKEINKEIIDNGENTITMTMKQYKNVLEPLFKEISNLNQQIRELNKEG